MVYILVSTMIKGVSVPGYASLMCVVLFLGSIQLISIGVLGEYLGRVSEEVKKRPVYVVSTIKGKLSNRLLEGYQKVGSGIYFNDKHTTKASASASVSESANDSASASAASAGSQATDSAAANASARTEK